MQQADLISKAPLLLKVCSANHIEHLVKQALPGMQLTHVLRRRAPFPSR